MITDTLLLIFLIIAVTSIVVSSIIDLTIENKYGKDMLRKIAKILAIIAIISVGAFAITLGIGILY